MRRRNYGNHDISRNHKRLYSIWHNMVERCTNPARKAYRHYGAVGVKVCDEWAVGPIAFYEWAMANGYAINLSIDRIDPTGGYEPANCRWVPMCEQSGNRRNRRVYTAWGETKSASEWLRDTRCRVADRRVIWHRVFIRGWGAEAAISTLPMHDRKQYVPKGERQWCAKLKDTQVADIRAALAAGVRGATLARQYGVSASTVSGIKLGQKHRT